MRSQLHSAHSRLKRRHVKRTSSHFRINRRVFRLKRVEEEFKKDEYVNQSISQIADVGWTLPPAEEARPAIAISARS